MALIDIGTIAFDIFASWYDWRIGLGRGHTLFYMTNEYYGVTITTHAAERQSFYLCGWWDKLLHADVMVLKPKNTP